MVRSLVLVLAMVLVRLFVRVLVTVQVQMNEKPSPDRISLRQPTQSQSSQYASNRCTNAYTYYSSCAVQRGAWG